MEDVGSRGVEPHRADSEGITDLMRWSWEGVPEAVRVLLERGADPNAKTLKDERAALFEAVEGKASGPEIARLLLEAGANPDIQNKAGCTPLMCLVGHPKSPDGIEPFRPGILDALLKGGADLEVRGRGDDATALICAAARNNVQYVKALIDAGADLTARTNFGQNALECARSNARNQWTRCALLLRTAMRERGLSHKAEKSSNVVSSPRASPHNR